MSSFLEDESILMLVASKLRNKHLENLYQAGLWPVMKQFASNGHFWYLRTLSLVPIELEFQARDWRTVYMNLRSVDFSDMSTVCTSGKLCLSRLGHVDTISVLLELGWKNDPKASTRMWMKWAMRSCCRAGNVAALQLMEKKYHKMSCNMVVKSMYSLIEHKKMGMFIYLLEHYPDPGMQASVHRYRSIAIETGNLEVLKYLDTHPYILVPDNEFVMKSVSRGHTDIVQFLLDRDLLGNRHQRSKLLKWSVRRGRRDIMSLLCNCIEGGWEVAVRPSLSKDISLLQEILEKITSPNRLKRQYTFVLACKRGKLEHAKLLLEYIVGSQASCLNNRAIRVAAKFGRREVVEWLLNCDGVTAQSALKFGLRWEESGIYQMLIKSIGLFNVLDLTQLDIVAHNLEQSMISRMKCVATCLDRFFSCTITLSEVFSWIAKPTNTYLCLLQSLILNNPTNVELLEWFRQQQDTEVKSAVRSVIFLKQPVCHTSKTFTAYRGLLVSIELGLTLSGVLSCLQREGASTEGLIHALVLIAARS